jgi:hypothetical protein
MSCGEVVVETVLALLAVAAVAMVGAMVAREVCRALIPDREGEAGTTEDAEDAEDVQWL